MVLNYHVNLPARCKSSEMTFFGNTTHSLSANSDKGVYETFFLLAIPWRKNSKMGRVGGLPTMYLQTFQFDMLLPRSRDISKLSVGGQAGTVFSCCPQWVCWQPNPALSTTDSPCQLRDHDKGPLYLFEVVLITWPLTKRCRAEWNLLSEIDKTRFSPRFQNV